MGASSSHELLRYTELGGSQVIPIPGITISLYVSCKLDLWTTQIFVSLLTTLHYYDDVFAPVL